MGDELEQVDWLDRQLREEAPYFDDAGFTMRVMEKLPARRATRSVRSAILLLSAVLASLGAYLLSGGGRFVYELLANAELFSMTSVIVAAAATSLCVTAAAAYTALTRVES